MKPRPQNGLAERLRAATAARHAQAERAGIMRTLLAGRIGRSGYCGLLRNLHDIYAALEGALDQLAPHPLLAPIALPGLRRLTALADDLRTLHGERWAEDIGVVKGTNGYVARLREIAAHRPELLVAHAYVRYLGDLSGGRILRRVVAESLQLGPRVGTAFYDFGEHAVELAASFRAGLDSIGAAAPVGSEIVAEAERAFALHVTLFEELAGEPSPGAAHSPLV